ncbi:MAG TPA: PKD domain-containing protein [Dermatophilaceae bacterium]|nr:PKD domain-containing protein [Dermatophilaceae bacterium]
MRSWRRLLVLLAAAVTGGLLLSGAGPVASEPVVPTLRFSAAGDYGAGSNSQAVFSTIGGLRNDLNLALGDMSYGTTGQEQAWCQLVKAGVGEGYPFQLLAGNHESNGLNGNINDFSACLPNQLPGARGTYGREYYVDVPATAPLVRFVMVSPGIPYPDGSWSYAKGTPRYAWTAAAIDGARGAGIPWVVAGAHYPCLSIGVYGCGMGADLMNLLVDKRVDLVLGGHEHMYQRSKQVATGPGCAAVTAGTYTAACVADADDDLVAGAGTVFATVGTGGIAQRDVNRADPEAGYFDVASGANENLTYGVLDMTATPDRLSASFKRAAGGSFADAFTLTKGTAPPNQPPTASFTSSCTDLGCAVDASASGDPDGTVASYAWAWGNGQTGAGRTASQTYPAAGTYTVRLTVTDDKGATGTTTRDVTVTEPPGTVTTYARDTFTRTVASGWGTADTGGAWTGSTGGVSVDGSRGSARINAGSGPTLGLGSFTSTATELFLSVSQDKLATGNGLYVTAMGRRITGVGDYRGKVRINGSGAVTSSLSRNGAGAGEVSLAGEAVVPGLTLTANDRLLLRTQVTGSAPTTVRLRVWKAGTPEPSTWQRSATDSTPGLQVGGAIGLALYVSGGATNAPVTASVDDLLVMSVP